MAALETAICNFVGIHGTTFIIARECMAYRAIEIRQTTVSNCVEMRGTAASNCMEMRGTVARKCVEPWLAWKCELVWTPPNRGSSARDASGKRAGSVAQVRLNPGSTHWWVPYLYETGTLRVKYNFKYPYVPCFADVWLPFVISSVNCKMLPYCPLNLINITWSN